MPDVRVKVFSSIGPVPKAQLGWNDLSGSTQRIYALTLCEKSERRYDGGFCSVGILWSVESGLLAMPVFGPKESNNISLFSRSNNKPSARSSNVISTAKFSCDEPITTLSINPRG